MAFPLALLCPAASLFHDPNGTPFADLGIDGHRETWPIRSRQFRHWLRRRYYEETGSAASAGAIRSAVDLLEARASLTLPSARFTSASPNTTAAPISTSRIKIGEPSRWDRMDGRSSPIHRFGSVVPLACCPSLFRREADRSKASQHS